MRPKHCRAISCVSAWRQTGAPFDTVAPVRICSLIISVTSVGLHLNGLRTPGEAGTVAVRSGQEQGRPAHSRKADRRLDRIPFRRKLDALVALPAVAIVALLAPLVIQQVNAARAWQAAASYMSNTEQVSLLIDDLGVEQEDALGVISSIQLVDVNAFDKA